MGKSQYSGPWGYPHGPAYPERGKIGLIRLHTRTPEHPHIKIHTIIASLTHDHVRGQIHETR